MLTGTMRITHIQHACPRTVGINAFNLLWDPTATIGTWYPTATIGTLHGYLMPSSLAAEALNHLQESLWCACL